MTLDRKVDIAHFHNVSEVNKDRWNHHVEVKSETTANSDWLRDLISQGYEFARG